MPAEAEGRSARAQRTRAAVVDALMGLLRDGSLAPGAREVAERAGVSTRTVFAHFATLEDLYQACVEQATAVVLSLLTVPALVVVQHWMLLFPTFFVSWLGAGLAGRSVDFDNGALGVIHATRWATGHFNELRLRVYGEKGGVEVQHATDATVPTGLHLHHRGLRPDLTVPTCHGVRDHRRECR